MMSESEVEIMSESDFEEENLSDDDESFMENDAPVPSKSKAAKAPAKKAPAKKKTALGQNKNADNVVVMEEIEIDPVVEKPASAAASKSKKTKTVEETYQKKSQLEHILLRPDTYSKFPLQCFRIQIRRLVNGHTSHDSHHQLPLSLLLSSLFVLLFYSWIHPAPNAEHVRPRRRQREDCGTRNHLHSWSLQDIRRNCSQCCRQQATRPKHV